MFTLVELQGFVAVAEEGGFRKGAERLGITQPPLSRQIVKLERSLGVQLLERTPTGIRLTPAGRAFLDEARAILRRSESARQLARSVTRAERGTLSIGFTAVVAVTLLGQFLGRLVHEMPQIELSLREAVTARQLEGIESGRLDLALARGVQETDLLAVRCVHAESFVLACADTHRFATVSEAPTVAEIARERIITYSPALAQYLHDLVIDVFVTQDLTPRYIQFVTQVTSALAIASAGVGVALVPESTRRLAIPGVVLRDIADAPANTVRTQAVWRHDNDNPALAVALHLLREVG